MKRSFEVRAVRSGKWWALSSPQAKNFHAQVKRLGDAKTEAVEILAALLDIAESQVRVEVVPEFEDERTRQLFESMASDLSRAVQAQEDFDRDRVSLIMRLMDAEQLTYREVGAVLGISHGRVNQIVTAHKASPRSSRAKRVRV